MFLTLICHDFVSKYRLPVIETYNSLQFLQREGYLEFTEEINNPSRVHFIVSRDDLYKFQVANESFDGFIKLLLRSYTGMFSEFVPVNEEIFPENQLHHAIQFISTWLNYHP